MRIGIDEAGRGAWAGPMVAAAVYFRTPLRHRWLRDSKKLSSVQRETILSLLEEHCEIGIGVVSNRYIDRYGLQKANVVVVEKALAALRHSILPTDEIVIDHIGGFKKYTCLKVAFQLYTSGEARFQEIAAASIVAKTYRDALMKKTAQTHPQYFFDLHKGYGTTKHRRALKQYGRSALHRQSFKPVALYPSAKKK